MKTVTLNQRKMNQHIAALNNSDEGTAFINCSMVKRLLTVTVTGELFAALVKLCYKVGPDNLVMQMVNTGHSKASVEKYISLILNR